MSKFAICFAVLLMVAQRQQAQPLDPGAIYKQESPAVVLIEVIGTDGKATKSGSGMLVSADGKLLTNYHVISHAKQATVRLANGDAYDLVEVLAVDKRRDIAYLKVPGVDLPTVRLGRSNTIEVGNVVFSIGNPLGLRLQNNPLGLSLQNTLSQGLVSGIREMDGYRLFQMSAPISPGSSGGPVFDSKGEVIGIAVATIEGGQNLNFAIPIDYARGMLTISQTQPLASIYEPEPTPEPAPKAPEATPATAAAHLNIPDEMRKGSMVYLEKQMGMWNLNDAKGILGEPTRQRDALNGSQVDGTIYAFPDPTNGMREFELNFGNSNGRLRGVYAYPFNATLRQAQALWGKNYREVKSPNGTRSFLYQDRHLILLVNKNDEIISIGVYP